MARTILTSSKTPPKDTVLFECSREDFFIALYSKGFSPVRVETDGHLIYIIYIRSEVEEVIKQVLDPAFELTVDYRKTMVAREVWRTYLQLLNDYKSRRQ